MRLSIGRVSPGHTTSGTAHWGDSTDAIHSAVWRRAALGLVVVLILGCVGLLFNPAKPAGAATPARSHRARSSRRWAAGRSMSTTRRREPCSAP